MQLHRDGVNANQDGGRNLELTNFDFDVSSDTGVPEGGLGPKPIVDDEQGAAEQPENADDGEVGAENEEESQASKTSSRRLRSTHPLDNVISPLHSGTQTRSKTRNMAAFLAFVSSIEPKNV